MMLERTVVLLDLVEYARLDLLWTNGVRRVHERCVSPYPLLFRFIALIDTSRRIISSVFFLLLRVS